MASDERKEAGDLSRFRAFEEHPDKHHIFQALRLIEAKYADQPRLGRSRRPKQDAVRLKQRVDMAFSSSTVARFQAKNEKTGEPGELAQYMFGLFGPNGPLPLHLTEYAYNRQRSFRDPTFKAFADIFHHRMLSLFYRAYASGEPTSSFDRVGETDPFAQKVAAFAGLKGKAMAGRDAMPDLAKLRYSGRLAHGTRNEEGLLALISGFFGAEATMESFVGTWLDLDKKDTWELGNPHKPAKLGQSCSIGSKVWTRQAKFRFRVGPVSLAEYKRLLPGGDSLQRLKSLVNNYMGEAMMWDMNLVLAQGEAEQAVLTSFTGDEDVSIVVSHDEDIVTETEIADGGALANTPPEWPTAPPKADVFTSEDDNPFAAQQEPDTAGVDFDPLSDAPGAETLADQTEASTALDQDVPAEGLGAGPSEPSATKLETSDELTPFSGDADSTDLTIGADSNAEGRGPFENEIPSEPPIAEAEADDMPPPPPLDMAKTVVLPMSAPPPPPKTSDEINFDNLDEPFEETSQFPPLSKEKGHEDDTRPKPTGVYLGWTAWLGTPPGDRDLDQLFIQSDAQPGE